MRVWTFLHILSMFLSVTASLGGDWLLLIAIRRRDLEAMRAARSVWGSVEAFGFTTLFLGIAFGLIAAVVSDLDLTQGWLVAAYVLVGSGILLGLAFGPYHKRLVAALDASDGDRPSPELSVLLASPRPRVATALSSLFLVLIVADMVLKPF
ncbi:MAG TPA: DUF2269 family protein [Actinomycetota bacterium]